MKRTARVRGPAQTLHCLKVSEGHIEQTCTAMLVLDGWRALKTNPVSNRGRGAGFGELGMADCLYIRYPIYVKRREGEYVETDAQSSVDAQVLWVEWKRRDGKAAAHQRDWHVLERKRGALTLIAGVDFEASIEGFKSWYLASGLNRRALA